MMTSPTAVVSLLCLSLWLCFAAGDHRKLAQNSDNVQFVVVFDGGSTGTRLIIYCFDNNMQLIKFKRPRAFFQRKKYEFSVKIKPGLSSYADNPEEVATKLSPLVEKAKSMIPENLRINTPIALGATAGLRSIALNTAEKIIDQVKRILSESELEYNDELVKIISGTDEGIFMWIALNYLKLKLGVEYLETYGVVELGGASVQMAYAISNNENLDEKYGKKVPISNQEYNIYSYSYLGYGSDAAREKVLEKNKQSSCLLPENRDSGTASEELFAECYGEIKEIFEKSAECEVSNGKCTFDGVWNGGGGDEQKNLVLAGNFFHRAKEYGYITENKFSGIICPLDIKEAALQLCPLDLEKVSSKYPTAKEKEYFCMDLVYQYALLVYAFELDEYQRMIVISAVKYNDAYIQASWALGMAVDIAKQRKTQH